jgi:anti-sigma-K factor RskA
MTARPEMDEDDRTLAAEYALGLLPPDAARAAEARLAADSAFRAEVALWSERLADLAGEVAPVAPPPRVAAALEARLFGPAPRPGPPARALWARLERLRGVAFGALAGAAVAAVLAVALLPLVERPLPPRFVAELAAEDRALVIRAQLDGSAIRLERLAGGPAPGRALELWLIAGDAAPVSLGVLPDAAEAEIAIPEALRPEIGPGAVLAVSDEPPGGSPTGQPTGTVLAAGAITNA